MGATAIPRNVFRQLAAECGGQCTSNPRGGGVLVEIDDDGFTVEPLELTSAATPLSVAAHMIYENANPNTMREPSGTLDVSQAMYEALDDCASHGRTCAWSRSEHQ